MVINCKNKVINFIVVSDALNTKHSERVYQNYVQRGYTQLCPRVRKIAYNKTKSNAISAEEENENRRRNKKTST